MAPPGVHEAAHHYRCQHARIDGGTSDPFGHRRAAVDRRVVAGERSQHRRGGVGLDADEFDVGAHLAGDNGHAGEEAAATDRNDEDVELAVVGEQLERDGAGSGDDVGGVEAVDECAAV